MSSSFWRFGHGYGEVSTINTLLKKSFIKKNPSPEQKDDEAQKKVRSDSSSSSDSDKYSSDFDFKFNHDSDEEEFDKSDEYYPNLEILNDLLDEQDLLDEVVGSNTKLIEYLAYRNVLQALVEYIISDDTGADLEKGEEGAEKDHTFSDTDSETSNSLDNDSGIHETPQEIHNRRAQVAAGILSSSAWSLTDSFMDNSDLLGKLWECLDKPCPLSMVLSTYFMKINEHLLDVKIEEMLNFLSHQDNLVDRFLRHIDNPPLMDFLLKVISTDKPDTPTGIVYLLKDQQLIPKLIDFLDPSVDSSIQSAAGDFIKAFVTISANSNTDNSTIGPNELTRELVSTPIMERLSDLMLHGGTSLSNGVGIIIEIIRKNNSDYDFVPVLYITIESHPPNSRDPIYLGHLIKVFQKKISKFTKLLKVFKSPELETSFGKIEPLGFERFKICELIAELLHCSNMGLLNDVFGEKIVHERDLERIRMIEQERQEQDEFQDELDLSNEASRNIDKLNIDSDQENQDNDEDVELNGAENTAPAQVLDTERDLEKVDNQDKDKEAEDQEKTSEVTPESLQQPILESEPDSDDLDAALDVSYDEKELEIRRNPVVGDQLKISLADNQVILIILNMFFRFPWNNFLHNVVFDIVQQILNGSMEIGYNKYLAIDLFGRGNVTQLIIDGQKRSEEYEVETRLRLGYMGHLTLIAEEVVKFTALYPPATIHKVVLDAVSTDEWTFYVTDTLVETREKHNALLGGVPQEVDEIQGGDGEGDSGLDLDPNVDHDIIGSGADVDDEEEDDENNRFSRYMSQELTNDLPDKFGSSDEDDDDDDVLVGWENQQYHHDDDDDYVDPNDDGQSYTKKNHPLYSDMLSPSEERPEYRYGDDDDSSSDSSSEEEEEEEGAAYEDEEDKGYTLTRTKSNGELNWSDKE